MSNVVLGPAICSFVNIYSSNFSQCQFINIFPHQKFALYGIQYEAILFSTLSPVSEVTFSVQYGFDNDEGLLAPSANCSLVCNREAVEST